jgi:VWFA-related protein
MTHQNEVSWVSAEWKMDKRLLVCSGAMISVLAGALLVTVLRAQNPPVMKRSTSLVLVPVSALDKSDHLVSGLTANDFHVFVDGKPMEIAHFDAITEDSPAHPSASAPLPLNTFRNIKESSTDQANLVVLFIDYLNTRLVDRMELRTGMLKYLATSLQPDQEIAVYGLTDRLVMIHPFTRDSGTLIEVARNLLKQKGQPPDPIVGRPLVQPGIEPAKAVKGLGTDQGMEYFAAIYARQEYNLDQLHRAQRTLEAFRDLSQSFAGIAGKKTVIWLTGDVSPLNPTLMYRILIYHPEVETQATPWWEMAKTYEALNAAGMSIFPVDIRGIGNPGMLPSGDKLTHDEFQQTFRGSDAVDMSPYPNPTAMREGEAANATLAMDTVAGETGGTVLAGSNDIDKLLSRAYKLWASYYVLAFVPEKPADDSAPAYHKIKVTVDKGGVRLLARKGYVSRPEALISSEAEIQRDLVEAASSPIDLTSIALQVTLGESRDVEKVRHFPFTVTAFGTILNATAEEGAPYDLTIGVLVRDQDGKVKSRAGKRLKGTVPQAEVSNATAKGLRYDAEFEAPIGSSYFGRVVVRDNFTGRIGTLTLALPTEDKAATK